MSVALAVNALSRAGSLLQGNAFQNVGVSLLAMAIQQAPQKFSGG
jgi:hypothetical protein